LDRIPYRSDGATFLAAPAFHGTGLSQLILTVSLGSTVVLRRRFDAEAVPRGIQDNRCTAVVMVPTMLQRVLDLGPDVLARYDTSTLRIAFVAGSALSPELGNQATAAFGDVLYNLYGSTEVAVATVATPADWKAAPGTVGRIPVGCHVTLYDEHDRRIARPHQRGRVFVGSGLASEGYTGGAHKEILDGLLSSGDAGYFDEAGRLSIDGRSDDMVISGGENVFPAEIENLLVTRGDVRDAAVLGVADADFGQRLKAYVVPEPGTTPEADALRAYVKDNLARYKVPKMWCSLMSYRASLPARCFARGCWNTVTPRRAPRGLQNPAADLRRRQLLRQAGVADVLGGGGVTGLDGEQLDSVVDGNVTDLCRLLALVHLGALVDLISGGEPVGRCRLHRDRSGVDRRHRPALHVDHLVPGLGVRRELAVLHLAQQALPLVPVVLGAWCVVLRRRGVWRCAVRGGTARRCGRTALGGGDPRAGAGQYEGHAPGCDHGLGSVHHRKRPPRLSTSPGEKRGGLARAPRCPLNLYAS